MSRYQIETTAPNGAPVIVPIPDEFLEQVTAARHAELLRIVWGWVINSGNDIGLTTGDLIYDLERAGYPCPEGLNDDE